MTVTMEADEPTVVQVCKQLAKLVEVEKVKVLPPRGSATRSMVLVKVRAGAKRMELLQLAEVFRAHAVDVTGESLIFVATGDEGKLKAFVDVMRPYGVTEMVQTSFCFDTETVDEDHFQERVAEWIHELAEFDGQATILQKKEMPENEVILGKESGRWYLARALRQRFNKLKRKPARKFKCVFSEELLKNRGLDASSDNERANGSLMHITAIFGLTIAGLILNEVYHQEES